MPLDMFSSLVYRCEWMMTLALMLMPMRARIAFDSVYLE